jgi:NAD(P)-dependent dehydrogenase (short-subunit alcohol dehydrogenase family)
VASIASNQSALVVGAGGGIGSAVVARLLEDARLARVYAVSRSSTQAVPADDRLCWLPCDGSDEQIAAVVSRLDRDAVDLARVVIASGVLHGQDIRPERALTQIDPRAMASVLEVNTILPARWLAALEPALRGSSGAVVAVLSARVGSIGDNALGGWYSYRASKAALNMVLASAAVELGRKARQVKLLAFHPGTTDTALSAPFQSRVPEDKLFTPAYVAGCLADLMERLEPDRKLSFLDYAGEPIPW